MTSGARRRSQRLDDARRFLLGLARGDGTFRFSPATGASNLLSTCFALLALELLGELPRLALVERKLVRDLIRGLQRSSDGLFVDPRVVNSDLASHDASYLTHQLTDFALMALQALDGSPRYGLGFLKSFGPSWPRWLEALDWSDPWMASNRIMFLLDFLLFEQEHHSRDTRDDVTAILDWLDANQDPDTGLWCRGASASRVNQMAATYHFLHFYTYLDRQPHKLERIVDSTLPLQDADGLFTYAGGGGSCEDLDAVDLLCRCTFYTDHRRHDIEAALGRAYEALWRCQNHDGGFCWARRDRLSLRKLRDAVRPHLIQVSCQEFARNFREKIANQLDVLLRPNALTWAYSGVETMRVGLADADGWSTWFRLLAIAEIELTFPAISGVRKPHWTMRAKPGIGFYR